MTDDFVDLHFEGVNHLRVRLRERDLRDRREKGGGGREREKDSVPGHAHLCSWFSSMKGGHHHHRHHRGCGCQHLFRKVLVKCGCCYARVRGQWSHTPMKTHRLEFGFSLFDVVLYLNHVLNVTLLHLIPAHSLAALFLHLFLRIHPQLPYLPLHSCKRMLMV